MTVPTAPPTATPEHRQLQLFVTVDLAFTVVAGLSVVALSRVLPPSPTYPLVMSLPAGAAVLMAMALRPLRAGRVGETVAWMAVANWGIALAASAVVTFLWPLMLLVAVLPCFLAVSFLRGRVVRAYLGTSVAVAVAVVLLGVLQDFSGFTADTPEMAQDALLIVVTPVIAALIGLLTLSNDERNQRALAAALRATAALESQAAALRASRARIVAVADRERRRIERDLHDGAQQRLVAIKLHVAQARRTAPDGDGDPGDPAALRQAIEAIGEEITAAHRELRDLAQGLYPPVLVEHGLGAALRAAADRSTVPVSLDLHEPLPRVAPAIEAALYFCVVEALQNTAKHAGPSATVRLSAGVTEGGLWAEVADDGAGFDPAATGPGTGLQGLEDRLGAAGGHLDVTTRVGQGTTVRASVPAQTAAPAGAGAAERMP